MSMDRQQMERCLEHVAAYRASGQTAQVWGQANDIPLQSIRGWCAQSQRWQARLDGVGAAASAPTPAKPVGFVIAQVGLRPVAAAASVRVNVSAGTARLELHWPLTHTRELAAWVRELGR